MSTARDSVGVFSARVTASRGVCTGHYLLQLAVRDFPPSQPGQFVHIRCGRAEAVEGGGPQSQYTGIGVPARVGRRGDPPGRPPRIQQPETAGRQPLLRRPISLAGRRDLGGGQVELDIIYHVVGVGTAWLAELAPGDEVDILGPLGNGFSLEAQRPMAALVGGGVGIPPMIYLAQALGERGRPAVAFAGARTAALLPLTLARGAPPSQAGWPTMCAAEFAARGTPTVVATDDGSLGVTGYVHQALERWLLEGRQDPAALAVYACGPLPMIRAVVELCRRRELPCQVAMERHMGCGLGACQGCNIKVISPEEPGWRYRLVCKDGPVFDGEALYFEKT